MSILRMSAVLVVIGVLLVASLTWPNPPWSLLTWGMPVAAVIVPLLFYPFSKVLFVAIDLALYPNAQPDEPAHGLVRNPKRDE